MAAKVLVARDNGQTFHIIIHLDTTKVDAESNPLPAYVGTWDFSNQIPAGSGLTMPQYKLQVAQEVKLLAADLLARINAQAAAGVALPIEGTTF